ncbi:ComF family protein [Sphingobacterium sp. Mn56C]|uniref:ComF family protein n=1 Tax=Sphingobacterium sp. Mn56C TaxID=3395261 RepID=UPI003BD44F3D
MRRKLWGRLNVNFAAAMLYLSKSSRVESLVHQLKYKKKPQVGIFLGEIYAPYLEAYLLQYPVDLIVPIPVHSSTLKKRGYNQAEKFAQGLGLMLHVPVDRHILIRPKRAASQVTLKKIARLDNLEGAFALHPKAVLRRNMHILLVDDVFTTGATICEAGRLLVAAGVSVSVVTLATA